MCNLSPPSNPLVILDLKISTETKIETLVLFFFSFSFFYLFDRSQREIYFSRYYTFMESQIHKHKIDAIGRVFFVVKNKIG